jgi:hypothetical protein
VLRFITAHSVEEKILERAVFKLGIDQKVIGAGMFNNQATGEDRRAMLESLLRESSKAKRTIDADDVGDDDDDANDDNDNDKEDKGDDESEPDEPALEADDDDAVNRALARMNDAERKQAEAAAAAAGADSTDRRALNEACQRVLDVATLHEYRLFTQLDQQRRASPANVELLNDEELPYWARQVRLYFRAPTIDAYSASANYIGRGRRDRSGRRRRETSIRPWSTQARINHVSRSIE